MIQMPSHHPTTHILRLQIANVVEHKPSCALGHFEWIVCDLPTSEVAEAAGLALIEVHASLNYHSGV